MLGKELVWLKDSGGESRGAGCFLAGFGSGVEKSKAVAEPPHSKGLVGDGELSLAVRRLVVRPVSGLKH